MVRYCFVELCKNTRYKAKEASNSKYVSLYMFPSNPQLREEWVQALIALNGQKSALSLPKMASICAEHFDKNCFVKMGFSSLRLKPNSVPTIFPRANNERMEMMSSCNYPDVSLQEQSSEMPALMENNPVILPSLQTPSTPRKKIRYPGDISDNMLDEMTLKTLKASVRLLKESCKKKDTRIKHLQVQQTRLIKKIKSLQQLLSDLKKRNLISSNTSNGI